jgi:hypothetical protein
MVAGVDDLRVAAASDAECGQCEHERGVDHVGGKPSETIPADRGVKIAIFLGAEAAAGVIRFRAFPPASTGGPERSPALRPRVLPR